MDRFVTFHRCLLTLALVCVQLLIPVSATAALFRGGVALHDICSIAAPADSAPSGDATDLPSHAGHCGLCTSLAAPPPQALATHPPEAAPRRLLRLGQAPRHALPSAAPVPARGPPAAA